MMQYAQELSSKYNNAPFYIIDAVFSDSDSGASDRWAQELLNIIK
jgi:hypothetical protein